MRGGKPGYALDSKGNVRSRPVTTRGTKWQIHRSLVSPQGVSRSVVMVPEEETKPIARVLIYMTK